MREYNGGSINFLAQIFSGSRSVQYERLISCPHVYKRRRARFSKFAKSRAGSEKDGDRELGHKQTPPRPNWLAQTGATMAKLRARIGATMVKHWARTGTTMVKMLVRAGATIVKSLVRAGATMVKFRAHTGTTMVKFRPRSGKTIKLTFLTGAH